MALVESVNVGAAEPNPYKSVPSTGIGKRPQEGPVEVRAPGDDAASGLVGDFIGDTAHHGGEEQAVYAFAREDLDEWERRLGRELADGAFGENLTTRGLDVNGALLGERWRVGDAVELAITAPRVPCSTFRGRMGTRDWLKVFTRAARPGAYLRVVRPGAVRAGDEIEVVHRPAHDVTVALAFRAITLETELVPRLLSAGDDLVAELRDLAERRVGLTLDE